MGTILKVVTNRNKSSMIPSNLGVGKWAKNFYLTWKLKAIAKIRILLQNHYLNYFGKTTSKWAGHSNFTCLGQTTGAKCAWKVLLRSVIGMPWSIGGNSSISINLKNCILSLKFSHSNTEKLTMVWAEGGEGSWGRDINYMANQPL